MSEKQSNIPTSVRSECDICSYAWVEESIICCFINKKTYLYSKVNDTMRSKLLNENVLYSQFQASKNKIYCAKAFGGLDIYRNGKFDNVYDMESNPDNFALGIVEYSDFVFLVLSHSILVFRDDIFEFQYKIPKHMVIYNCAYDKESKYFILAYISSGKQMLSSKKID